MAHAQYGGVGPARYNAPTIAVSTSGGALSPGSLYFFVQAENRVGANLLSSSTQVTWTNQNYLTWTIPIEYRPEGSDVRRWTLSASSVDDETTAVQVCQVEAYEVDGSQITLPIAITLSSGEHVALNKTVFDQTLLPTTGLLRHGMMRGVEHVYQTNENGSQTDLGGFIYRYNAHSVKEVLLPNVISAEIGRWERAGTFSVYFGDSTQETGGCDRSVFSLVDAEVDLDSYEADGSLSERVRFWLFYDRQIEGTSAAAGSRMSIDMEIDGEPFNQLLKLGNRCEFTFVGYVDRLTGGLDVFDLDKAGSTKNLAFGETAYVLEKVLPAASAVCFDVAIRLDKNQFAGEIGAGTIISIGPKWMPAGGEYVRGVSRLFGNIAMRETDSIYGAGTCRVIPAPALSATIQHGRLYIYDRGVYVERQTLFDLEATTAIQKVIVDGNGYWRAVSSATNVVEPEALRAIVRCESGESGAGSMSAWTALTAGELRVIVTYPQIVRADYPDIIAGEGGTYNAPSIYIYLESQQAGQIRKFGPFVTVPFQTTQTFTISAFNGTIVTSLPTNPTPDFGCYRPSSTALANGGAGTVPANTYRVTYSFAYTGQTITSISHQPSGYDYIREMDTDMSKAAFTDKNNTFTKHQGTGIVTIADALNIVPDGTASNIFKIFLNTAFGTRTMQAPAPLRPGTYQFIFYQTLGGQMVAWSSAYRFPTYQTENVTTTAGQKTLVTCVADGTGLLYCVMATPYN